MLGKADRLAVENIHSRKGNLPLRCACHAGKRLHDDFVSIITEPSIPIRTISVCPLFPNSFLCNTEATKQASTDLEFEQAARVRDEIHLLETLDQRGELDTHVQPEVFYIDPKKGLNGLRKVLKMNYTPRTIEGIDIAHLGGDETVASLVQFIDGLPFKPGYRRYQIRGVRGIDDFRSIHEAVARRFQRLQDQSEVFPDILLIDGGKGQLSAAMAAFRELKIDPPVVVSLAKRDEELFLPDQAEPLRLSRHAYALRLLQYVRDESHRFAQHYHHILRRKSTLGEN